MKRIWSLFLTLLVIGFVVTVNVPAPPVDASENEFITMYKDFFKDLQGKRYQQVWDAMTLSGKNAIAKAINESAVSQNKESTQADVLNRLDKDSSNLRTIYFDNLNSEFNKISFYTDIMNAQYTVKSDERERVVVTISVKKEPKDFLIIREAGRWKINFFEDLMR